MTFLMPGVGDVEVELRSLPPDEVLALAVPYQRQADRAQALAHFQTVLAQLRRRGWQITSGVRRAPDGELLVIEPVAAPPVHATPAVGGPRKENAMPALAEELKQVQKKKAEVRQERTAAISERDGYRRKLETGASVDRNSTEYKGALESSRKASALGDELTQLGDRESELLVMMGRGDESSRGRGGNGPEDGNPSGPFGARAEQETADALTGTPGALLATMIERRKANLPEGSLAEHLRTSPSAAAALPISTTDVSNEVETLALVDLLAPRTVALASGIPVVYIDGTKTSLPRFTELPVAAWTPEDGEMPESGPGIEMVEVEPKKIGLVTPLTVEVFEDLRPPVLAALQAQMLRSIAIGYDGGILFGSGMAGQPRGVANTTGVGVVQAPLTDLAPFAQAIAALIASHAGVGALAMHPIDIGTLLQLVEFSGATNSNVPLWKNAINPDAQGNISPLLLPFFGVPIWPCPAAPQGMGLLYDPRAIVAVIRRRADIALDPFYNTLRGRVALRSYLRGEVLVAQAAGAVRIEFEEPTP